MKEVDGKVRNVNKSRARGMYTSPVVQERVRAKRLKGYTKTAIARQENICFATVQKILTDQQADEVVAQARRNVKALAEIGTEVLYNHLLKHNDVEVSLKILGSLGLIPTEKERIAAILAGAPVSTRPIHSSGNVKSSRMGWELIKRAE